jgi:hypothetical protein
MANDSPTSPVSCRPWQATVMQKSLARTSRMVTRLWARGKDQLDGSHGWYKSVRRDASSCWESELTCEHPVDKNTKQTELGGASPNGILLTHPYLVHHVVNGLHQRRQRELLLWEPVEDVSVVARDHVSRLAAWARRAASPLTSSSRTRACTQTCRAPHTSDQEKWIMHRCGHQQTRTS